MNPYGSGSVVKEQWIKNDIIPQGDRKWLRGFMCAGRFFYIIDVKCRHIPKDDCNADTKTVEHEQISFQC